MHHDDHPQQLTPNDPDEADDDDDRQGDEFHDGEDVLNPGCPAHIVAVDEGQDYCGVQRSLTSTE